MFDLLKSSVDRVLTNLGRFEYRGEEFTIRRHEFAPVTLRVRGDVRSFEVDLVPSLQYDFGSKCFILDFKGLNIFHRKVPSTRDNQAGDQLERYVQHDPGDKEVHGHLPPSRGREKV